MEGDTPAPPPPPAVSKVLNDDDLLAEILLRVGFPTTLVRAAAVCRRFLHHASDHKFLRRFRELHPPRLLGFHVVEVDWSAPTVPRFVPLLPQPPELAAVVRRASSSLRTYQSDDIASIRIIDCRSGSFLIEHREDGSGSTTGVLSLLCPERGMVAMAPRPQRQDRNYYAYWAILSREEEGAGGLSYLYVLIEVTPETKYTVQVFVLQHGVWCCTHSLAVDQLPLLLHEPKSVLNDNKIYIAAAQRELIVLDLATSSLATIQLPHGVEHGEKSTRLSRADDAAGVYLVHVKELQLCIWLHKGDGWLLVDTICLREMLASLGMLGCDASLRIKQVDDNAEFVFLEMDRCALHLDIKCRTLHKVYEVARETRYLGDIHPFMMIWPPTFPALKDDPASLDFDGLNCQSRPRKTRNRFFALCTFLPRSPSCPAPTPMETKMESAPPPLPPPVVSKVLSDDDLLAEILLRVGFPTTLVRAAAVCRRFLHHASDHKFLRRFRELHPPRLLGFHVVEVDWSALTVPHFVPLLPHPPELAAVVRRASSSLRAYQSDDIASIRIIDCRNGRVLIEHREDGSGSTKGVLNLLCPERGMVAVPPRPQPQCQDHNYYAHSEILSKEEGDGVSYVYVSIEVTTERKYMVHVYVLQHGAWCCTHSLAIHQLPNLLLEPESVLVDNRIYMAAAQREIVVLDLTSSRFSTIQLPQGVKYGERSTRLSRADAAAGIYLIHVKELQLRIWLHKGNGWLLVDTICLREMLASLSMLGCNASLRIKQVEGNAEFVFLEMGQCALHLDIKCRTLHKVYEVAKETRYLGDIHPFMMIWPPTFPALKDDPAREAPVICSEED